MYTIALCDDSLDALDRYSCLIRRIARRRRLDIRILTFVNAENLLFLISEYPEHIDVLYLDINMPEVDGLTAAKRLRQLGCQTEIIFLTVWKKYVFDSFEVRQFRYLLKDKLYPAEFETVLLEALDSCSAHTMQTYILKTPSCIIRLNIHNIIFLEVYDKTITIHCQDKTYNFRDTFTRMCREFEPYGFLKISQCYCINPTFIQEAYNNSITLRNGLVLPISRRYKKLVMQALEHLT